MVLGGVSAALARHLGRPVGVVRFAFVALSALGGGGALLYLWLWAVTPLRTRDAASTAVHRTFPVAAVAAAVSALGGVAAVAASLSAPTGRPVPPGSLECIAFGVLAVAWTFTFDPADGARDARYASVVRTVTAGVLIATGAGTLLGAPGALGAVLAVLMIALGSVVLLVPRFVTLWADLIAERSRLAGEVQRSEIAAHLHDSVLQTLALIQNRAGAGTEIARLARAQERELRDWLFAGTDPFAGDLPTELRSIAASLELEYPVRIDVVAVGEPDAAASASLIAATREAMVNAARHAGGDISVYLETAPAGTDVFVRDRGPGFRPAQVPAGRLGIRESIVGRMTRAGGTAAVTSTAAGTEVHLHLPNGVRR